MPYGVTSGGKRNPYSDTLTRPHFTEGYTRQARLTKIFCYQINSALFFPNIIYFALPIAIPAIANTITDPQILRRSLV